jgi:hypothetical protein
MPLSFYFNENIGVGNELLTHSIPIGVKKEYRLNKTTELNHYDVRFFVYRNPKDVNNYHRLTHCSFTTNKRISELFLYNDKDDVPPNKKI